VRHCSKAVTLHTETNINPTISQTSIFQPFYWNGTLCSV